MRNPVHDHVVMKLFEIGLCFDLFADRHFSDSRRTAQYEQTQGSIIRVIAALSYCARSAV